MDDIKNYFSRFGNVKDASIIKDPNTGRSRGFGFVIFENESTVKKVFDAGVHFINGKKVDAKSAFRRNAEPVCRKVFVGGVDPQMPENEIREYFSRYGEIEEIDFPWDKEKNQRRAFCFIAFISPEVVDEILKMPKHKLGDRMVDVKKATPKSENQQSNGNPSAAWSFLSQALNLGGAYGGNSLAAGMGYPGAGAVLPGTVPGNVGQMQSLGMSPAAAASVGSANGGSPYALAAAAAAAAAGLYPPTCPEMWSMYSALAMAAAAASAQDGQVMPSQHGTGMHPSAHLQGVVGGGGSASIGGSSTTGYGKSSRSNAPPSNVVGGHRNSGYHPYSR